MKETYIVGMYLLAIWNLRFFIYDPRNHVINGLTFIICTAIGSLYLIGL